MYINIYIYIYILYASFLIHTKESGSVSRSVVSNSLQPHIPWPARLLCPWNSPGKNTGVGCHSLLQGIFLTQGSNPQLLHCRWILYLLSHQGAQTTELSKKKKKICPFSLPTLLLNNNSAFIFSQGLSPVCFPWFENHCYLVSLYCSLVLRDVMISNELELQHLLEPRDFSWNQRFMLQT